VGDGAPDTSVVVDYAGDAYLNVPYITNFSAFADMDANRPFEVDLSAYVPGSNAEDSLIFFSIVDSSNNTVFGTISLPDSTTSILIPAGTLVAGETYTFDLLFDNRIEGTDDASGVAVTQFYDTHTFGALTPVPEASTWAM
jgi:hypothetical protein